MVYAVVQIRFSTVMRSRSATCCGIHQLSVSNFSSYRRRRSTAAFVEMPPDFFAIVIRHGRRLELTWNVPPQIADQFEGLLLRLEG